MNIHQQISQTRQQAASVARNLELTDRIAEIHGHPDRTQAQVEAALMRETLVRLYTRLHWLEARLPTPEVLSARAYDRAMALGLQIEAAEHARITTYREATHAQRHQRAA